MLGCNLGSSILPIWLLKTENDSTRVVALSVAGVRSGAAIVLIVLIALTGPLIASQVAFGAPAMILGGHVGFNLFLMALAPLCTRLVKLLEARMVTEDDTLPSTFTPDVIADRTLALSAIKRQLNRMLETASGMLEEVVSETPDKPAVLALERGMNADLAILRDAYAKLPGDDGADLRDVQKLLEFAVKIERCGDMLAGKFLTLKLEQIKGDYCFSPEGEEEITHLMEAVRRAIMLAQETCWSGDVETAQALVRHKQAVAEEEADSRSKHFARLRRGNVISLGSSDQHLEMIATLKELNSKFATIGYAVLDHHGGLKKTRLKSSVGPSAG